MLQLLGDFSPRPPTGALSLDLTWGLPSPDSVFSSPERLSHGSAPDDDDTSRPTQRTRTG